MSGAQTPETKAVVTTGDTKALIRAIVGTGIGLATLLLMLIGLVLQQNAAVNTRINDVNTSMNARIDDVNTSVNARFNDLNASMNARFNDVNARIDDLLDGIRELRAEVRSDIRELREIVINALKGSEPAD